MLLESSCPIPLTRAEGPAENSAAREDGDCKTPC